MVDARLPRESSWLAMLELAAAGFGAFLMLVSGIDLGNTFMARRWLATSGTVLISRVWYDSSPQDVGMGRTMSNISWQSYMKYRYDVGGKNYEAERITVEGYNNRRAIIARQSPAGSSITVFYDPANPARAAIDRNTSLWTYVWFVSGLAIVAFYIFWRIHVMSRRQFTSTVAR